jgi:CheY-like chemotaxis protein
MTSNESNRETRYLGDKLNQTESRVPTRVTGPLDDALPWVIEFRVVGTAKTFQVQVHEAMLIGRTDPQRGVYPDVDLDTHGGQGQGVSRQHAMVLVKDNRTYIKDLGSVNGTRLNGSVLKANSEYRLHHDDQVEIGQVKLQVRFAVVPTVEGGSSQNSHVQIPIIGHGQNILVVEDDHDVGNVFSLALEHAGFHVTVMETATSALGYVSEHLPDVIVLDLMLPDMNGADLARYVRKQEASQHIPVIIVSGATGGFHANQAMESGVDKFLSKPVGVDELVRAVGQVLSATANPMA